MNEADYILGIAYDPEGGWYVQRGLNVQSTQRTIGYLMYKMKNWRDGLLDVGDVGKVVDVDGASVECVIDGLGFRVPYEVAVDMRKAYLDRHPEKMNLIIG